MWVQVPLFTVIFWKQLNNKLLIEFNEIIFLEKSFSLDIEKNFNGRDFVSYLLEEDEISDNVYFTDWFEFVKNARKVQAEKKYFFLKNASIIKQNANLLKQFKESLIDFNKNFNKIKNINILKQFYWTDKKIKFFNLFSYYLNLNYNKIKKLNNGNYFNNENLIVLLDIRKSKPKIFILKDGKCFFSLTGGLIFKKLNLSKKKIKKSEKMLKLLLKTTFIKLQKLFLSKNYIIHIKGTKSNIFNILLIIGKSFKKKLSLIYSPYISYGRFKFKKIKSIKKRLRKKFTRLIKN